MTPKVRFSAPNKRDWLLALLVVCIGMTLVYISDFIDRAEKRAFDAMTPAEHQAAQLAEERRKTAVRNLQDSLKNLGYDLTVAQSDKPDEIVITSKDFDDTDHRVRFLSRLRGRNSPAAEVCLAGFQTVRLKTPGDLFGLFGFSEAYSLECFTWR